MERSRVPLTALLYVLLLSQRRIYGAEIEMKVRPGDNITIYCDRPLTHGSHIAWMRNCSHVHQPSLIINHMIMDPNTFPRYSFLKSSNINSLDLHITNITNSDLGLYYCAELEKHFTDKNSLYQSNLYHYGKQTTRLSFADTSCSGGPSTVSPPHVWECFLCWMLLVSVCAVCVLLCSICVYCLFLRRTTDAGTKTQKEKQKNTAEGDDEVCYASLDVMNRRQKPLKKKQLQTSDFSTYSQVRTETTQNFS